MEPIKTQTNLQEGSRKQIDVLFSDEKRKIVLVTLREGELFAEHSTKVPLMIYCTQGCGSLIVGERSFALTPGVLIPLDAHVVHAVQAQPSVALLLTLFR